MIGRERSRRRGVGRTMWPWKAWPEVTGGWSISRVESPGSGRRCLRGPSERKPRLRRPRTESNLSFSVSRAVSILVRFRLGFPRLSEELKVV